MYGGIFTSGLWLSPSNEAVVAVHINHITIKLNTVEFIILKSSDAVAVNRVVWQNSYSIASFIGQ